MNRGINKEMDRLKDEQIGLQIDRQMYGEKDVQIKKQMNTYNIDRQMNTQIDEYIDR